MWGLKAAFIGNYVRIFTICSSQTNRLCLLLCQGLYFSLFNPNNTGKALRYALYFVCVFLTATFVVNGSLAAFWCLPIHTTWFVLVPLIFGVWRSGNDDVLKRTPLIIEFELIHRSMGAHSCSALFNIEPTVIFYTTNVVSDLMIMILPIAVIPSLKLRRRETIALLSVFLLGIFSIGASTARFIVVYKVIANKTNAATSIQSLELWSTVECATAMIAFCAPAYRGWLTKKATSGNGSNLSGSKGKPQIALWTIGSGPRKSKRTMGDSVFADTIDERRTYIGMESQIELKSSPIHEEDESKVRLGNVTEEVYYGQKDYVPYKARGNEV